MFQTNYVTRVAVNNVALFALSLIIMYAQCIVIWDHVSKVLAIVEIYKNTVYKLLR